MRVPDVSPRVFRRLMVVIVGLLAIIIVTGAAVRLTNSGLGCPQWPNCNARDFVAVTTHHQAIEQLNRLLSGAIGIPIALALFASYRRRPRRRDLIMLSWVLFALFWGEAVLGGITVIVKLAWVSVMGHFLLAIALVGVALTMHHRGRDTDATGYVVSGVSRFAARAVYVLTIWVLVAGTLVTAAGPHGGDAQARRLGFPIADVARVHATSVDILIVAVVAFVIALWRERAPRRVLVVAEAMLLAMVAQAVVGYVQYFNGVPPLLVGFHVAGAVLVFGTVHQLQLELRGPVDVAVDVPASVRTPVGAPAPLHPVPGR
jgi:cytochrome c oxidase assembly protein subunit 15